MFDIGILTTVHTAISLIAMVFGVPAIRALYGYAIPSLWTKLFLIFAVLTTLTGFFFPFNGVTPAFATGIAASIAFIAMLAAFKIGHLQGIWRGVYAGGMVASVYFLWVAFIAQAFLKIPALHVFAPTGTEPPFLVAQVLAMAIFTMLGVKAIRKFHPAG